MKNIQNQGEIDFEEMGKLIFGDYSPEEKETETKDEVLNIEVQAGETKEEEDVKEDTLPDTTEETPDTPQTTNLKDIVKELVETKEWEDYQIEHGDKTYDSILELIEEVEITPEMFKGLLNTQTKEKIDKIKEQAVILDKDVDPTRAELVKAIAEGLEGYQPFIETYDNLIKPLKELDLSEPNIAANLLYKYYKEVNQWDDEYIQHKINQHQKDLTLNETAEWVRKTSIENFQNILEERKKEEEQLRAEKEKEIAKQRQDLKTHLKEQEYSDLFISKALPLIYATDGDIPHWQKEINHRVETQGIEFQVELAHWLLDRDDYVNKKIAPKKREESLKKLNTINILGAAKKKQTTAPKKDDDILDIFAK